MRRSLEPQKFESCTMSPMSRKQWGHGNIYVRGRVWWIYYSDHGRMVRESSGSRQRKDAEALLKRRLAAVSQGRHKEIQNTTVDELLDDLLADYAVNDKRVDWARIVVGHLRPHFGRYRAASVGTALVNSYIERRKRLGRSNATINRELAILRSAYYMGLRSDPPKVDRVPMISKMKEAPARKGFFEAGDFYAIAKHLPPDIRDVATFARIVGCRRSEILAIQWGQVDFRARMVRLESGETKNDEPRIVPMNQALYAMLWKRKRERDEKWPDSPWVFSRSGSPIKSFKASWEAACTKAGLTGRAARLFHDLRRTAVRNMIRVGIPEKVAMRISGHKTRSVFDRYHIVDERDLADAGKMLDQVGEM
jgi:integrase